MAGWLATDQHRPSQDLVFGHEEIVLAPIACHRKPAPRRASGNSVRASLRRLAVSMATRAVPLGVGSVLVMAG